MLLVLKVDQTTAENVAPKFLLDATLLYQVRFFGVFPELSPKIYSLTGKELTVAFSSAVVIADDL